MAPRKCCPQPNSCAPPLGSTLRTAHLLQLPITLCLMEELVKIALFHALEEYLAKRCITFWKGQVEEMLNQIQHAIVDGRQRCIASRGELNNSLWKEEYIQNHAGHLPLCNDKPKSVPGAKGKQDSFRNRSCSFVRSPLQLRTTLNISYVAKHLVFSFTLHKLTTRSVKLQSSTCVRKLIEYLREEIARYDLWDW